MQFSTTYLLSAKGKGTVPAPLLPRSGPQMAAMCFSELDLTDEK